MDKPDLDGYFAELLAKVMMLSERPWEGRPKRPEIDRWLGNFVGNTASAETEQLHALYLLSVFTYFGEPEVRVLLRSMFRDVYRYPIIEEIRQGLDDTQDALLINRHFQNELLRTRFIGMGNPAESGTHLLYFFRQENSLHNGLFIGKESIFGSVDHTGAPVLANPDVRHYVFIDDFCGSGSQATSYSQHLIAHIHHSARQLNVPVTTAYYVLVATKKGMEAVRTSTRFDRVETVFELDDTYKAFSSNSRYFPDNDSIVDRLTAFAMASSYGVTLDPDHPTGYLDGQLLLGFHYNIPDNTLPIIWFSGPTSPWFPIFRRFQKVGV